MNRTLTSPGHRIFNLVAAIVIALAAALPARAQQAARISPAAAQAELEALIKAAKAEGEIRFYTAATENVGKRVVDAFNAKYGIKGTFVRINSIGLQQRFAAEAEASTFAVDALLNSGDSVSYAQNGIKRGWIDSLTSANLPVITSGEFPSRFNREVCAAIQISPWSITYNTDKVKGADVPKDWPDLLNPKWKGQLAVSDPRSSNAYLDLYAALIDRYGEPWFAQLRAQNPRWYLGGPPQVQALAAGEGMLGFPVIGPQVQAVRDKGGPLAVITPDYTAGVEMHVMLSARAKSKNPNAARLMANYVMPTEGNKVFNDDPGGATIYDTSKLPKEYVPSSLKTEARRDQIIKLLGLQ